MDDPEQPGAGPDFRPWDEPPQPAPWPEPEWQQPVWPGPPVARAVPQPGEQQWPAPWPQPGSPVPQQPPHQPWPYAPAQFPAQWPYAPSYAPPQAGYPGVQLPTGALAWFLGLLVLIGFPFLNLIVTGIVMTAVGASQRRLGGVPGRFATGAMRWGIAVAALSAGLMVAFYALLSQAAALDSTDFLPIGWFFIAWLLLSFVHLVVCIVQGIRANTSKPVPGPWPGGL